MTTTINIDESLIENELFPLVDSWLLLKTRADVIREKVDAVYSDILQKTPVYVSDEFVSKGAEKRQILHRDQLYLAGSEVSFRIIGEVRKELSKHFDIEGIENEPFYSYKCPALVAEGEVRDVERLIIKCLGRITGQDDFYKGVMSSFHKTYHKSVDLAVRMVVNHPRYKNPLTKLIKDRKNDN